ncbi:MAG: MarC family protein [Porphyrobacter sp.]|nr:MarC family protein [Porphyrobacter sp.]
MIDPPGCAPIYAGLTKGASPAQARSMALRATIIAAIILLIFALFGKQLLGALHIELNSFRIAGGTPEIEDVSVFPMAMPMLAGPGAIAAVMLLMNEAAGDAEKMAQVLAALGAVLLITAAALVAAGPLIRLLGDKVEAVITRLLGVLLSALAAQYVIDGLKGSFGV